MAHGMVASCPLEASHSVSQTSTDMRLSRVASRCGSTLAVTASLGDMSSGPSEFDDVDSDDEDLVRLMCKSESTQLGSRSVDRNRFFLQHQSSARLHDIYDVEDRPIGRGGFGSVRKAWAKGTGGDGSCALVRAVKTVLKRDLRVESMVRREIGILRQLDHPSICRLFETFDDGRSMHLVMEFVDGQDLFEYIQNSLVYEGRELEESLIFRLMQQLLAALRYCHGREIIHRDLKPENIMVQKGDKIKLIDFGLAAVKKEERPIADGQRNPKHRTSFVGTYDYVAPEAQRGTIHPEPPLDMWSSGMVLHALLMGGLPDVPVREGETRFDPTDTAYTYVSCVAMELMVGLLELEPQKRLTASDAYQMCEQRCAPKGAGAHRPRRLSLERSKDAFVAFHQSVMLRRAVLTALAMQCAGQEEEEIQKQFMAADRDGNGRLSLAELSDSIANIMPHFAAADAENWIESIFASLDTDGSQEIEYSEFLAAAVQEGSLRCEQAMKDAFRVFDIDRNGTISVHEFARVLDESPEEIQRCLPEFDMDGDGEISFDEFKAMIAANPVAFKGRLRTSVGDQCCMPPLGQMVRRVFRI